LRKHAAENGINNIGQKNLALAAARAIYAVMSRDKLAVNGERSSAPL